MSERIKLSVAPLLNSGSRWQGPASFTWLTWQVSGMPACSLHGMLCTAPSVHCWSTDNVYRNLGSSSGGGAKLLITDNTVLRGWLSCLQLQSHLQQSVFRSPFIENLSNLPIPFIDARLLPQSVCSYSLLSTELDKHIWTMPPLSFTHHLNLLFDLDFWKGRWKNTSFPFWKKK